MASPVKNASTKKHKVLKPLRHNSKHYVPGSVVDLTSDAAKPLLARKVVAPLAVAEPEAEAPAAGTSATD